MKPYYDHAGVRIFNGDAREILPSLPAECLLTDPVWPNSVFPSVAGPQRLLTETLSIAPVKRIVIHLGCDSDPRFLMAVPSQYPFFRTCDLEYCSPSYKGRLLYTADVAYVFGPPPAARKGAMVIPGKCLSTTSDGLFKRGTGRQKHKSRQQDVYRNALHPCPRRLQHVRWLAKWFGGASVVDPFAGSGTTGLACKLLGVPCDLIEIEERFCELAVSRLSQEEFDLVEDLEQAYMEARA